jgi:hypothetical protein
MMVNRITLHPKYGLNPTISQCLICGKDLNEIALLGNHYKEQAPMHMVTSIIPCDECREKYLSVGVLLLKAYEDGYGKPVVDGDCFVITDEAFKKLFTCEIPVKKIAYLEEAVFNKIYKDYNKDRLSKGVENVC